MGKAFKGQATRTAEGLWVAKEAQRFSNEMRSGKARRGLFTRRDRKRTVYGPTGRPIAVVHVSGFGNTEHEFDDHQDAVVRPDPVKVDLAELRDRTAWQMNVDTSGPLPPPGFLDAELARLRARVETNPGDADAWAEYKQAKNVQVAWLAERKLRRDRDLGA